MRKVLPVGRGPKRKWDVFANKSFTLRMRLIVGVALVDAPGRAQARTMDAFAPDDRMVVWLATNPKSRRVARIQHNPRVTLYYFNPQSMG